MDDTIANIDHSIETLDSEIAKIREEIKNFQTKRRLLSASLLSSDYVRQTIETNKNTRDGGAKSAAAEVSTLLSDARQHRETNYHRIAFSTTSFPWKDPNPYSASPTLLGIRIDVSQRDGTFAKPYYVLLRRTPSQQQQQNRRRATDTSFSIYRHTIPPFIPLDKLAHRYLPQPRPVRDDNDDDEIESIKTKAKTRKQDLSNFARQLRKELAAWHVRHDSIAWLQEQLSKGQSATTTTTKQSDIFVSLSSTSLECRYVRLEWRDGRVGRFKISNSGLVERAVVIGHDAARDKRTERSLMGGDRRVETLVERLLTTK